LPPALLPADWPGGALRAAYDRWDARYRSTLSEWSRAGA
jgi:DNA-binding transcriptional regulator PaaX